MREWLQRTEMLVGEEKCSALAAKKVAVFGIGGVGSYVVEALARAGIGSLLLVDNDTVALSNINRQLIALHSTVGMSKAEAAEARVKDINPECAVRAEKIFVTPENAADFGLEGYDYVIDAVDNVSAKIALIKLCTEAEVPIISSMGTGNKLDASKFQIADIFDTSVCPLARVMRSELKKRGIKKLKVLFSTENPACASRPPASISFVPSVAGLLIAGEAVRNMLMEKL